jgi:hypothetical protein
MGGTVERSQWRGQHGEPIPAARARRGERLNGGGPPTAVHDLDEHRLPPCAAGRRFVVERDDVFCDLAAAGEPPNLLAARQGGFAGAPLDAVATRILD